MYLIFDTETTGIPHNKTAPLTDFENWPRLVQLAWQLHDANGKLLSQHNYLIKPDGFDIPFKAEQIHGISTRRALEEGHDLKKVLSFLQGDLARTQVLVGHNIEFDINIIGAEFLRTALPTDHFLSLQKIDTGLVSVEFCQLTGGLGGRLKIPRLTELHEKLFGKKFQDAHDASYDVAATARSFFGLIEHKVIRPFDATPPEEIEYEEPILQQGNSTKREEGVKINYDNTSEVGSLTNRLYCHLHVHSQYSVLQATPDVEKLILKAKEYNMPAIALTDLGNMYGAFEFVSKALAHNIKPVVGCEFYISTDRKKLKFTKDDPDKRYNQVLLAKNKTGYQNLAKLSSIAYLEGLYGLYPRIDKELVVQYKEGVMATTGGLASEIPYLILHVGERQAEEAFAWWHKIFGEDFYAEINRHGTREEERVNETLLKFSRKYSVKYFAANECYYLEKEEANAHDVLLCIKEGEFQSTPIGEGRGKRYGLPNDQFYLKSQEEMKHLFHDLPQALDTIEEIVSKVEKFELKRNVLLPKFDIPKDFSSEDEYLKHLTYEGAKRRYPSVTAEIKDRLDFELEIIRKTGYPGYFLIVQDFTSKARELGVSVGPGRGSAAGSAVAFCIGITNVDPIAYDLLFERFLNPDRVSLPDIDIDFDDEGRDKVLKYVIEKYGHSQVAQIITYGTMAAKSSIRDCARVMELPLADANMIAKMVPERPGTTLEKAFEEVRELSDIKKGTDKRAEVLKQAIVLEGSLRNTGTHACGVIITPDALTNFVPVAKAKDSDMLVTQFDNSVVESAGLLKMDFLGLTTLTIIATALKNIKKRRGITIDIDSIPLDDLKTYQLYQRGETTGTFQFESDGMIAYLKALKPDKFEDLIAMNALYRPGPMEYIPNFIARKNGREPIKYDLPEMEEYLKGTYGITVYQEQVMLLSQKLADFSKGDADVLRKAMGKKQIEVLNKMKDKFIEGCKKNNHDERIAEKVWKDWEAFAQYAFNKSHSTCYSLVAYQTAYLKANYTAEYMAAVLTHSQSNLDNVTYFIDECRKQNIEVLGPHINESGTYFEVNDKGEIRFGMGAIKGAGEAAVEAIIQERDAHGAYTDIFDFAKRLSQRSVNKKTFECLALSGAFDCFTQYHRRQYIAGKEGDTSLTEKVIRYAAKQQQESQSAQASLFGASTGTALPLPKIESIEPFTEIEKLHFEKEVVGVYISGHPLDNFKFELDTFTNTPVIELNDLDTKEGKDCKMGGIVSSVEHRLTKTGKPFGKLSLEDYSGKYEFTLWSEDYLKYKSFLMPGIFLFIEGNIVRKTRGDMAMEFKIRSMDLLNEIGTKRAKGLQLKVTTATINQAFIAEVEKLCNEYSGSCPLYVKIQDEDEKINLEMLSRKFRIKAVNEAVVKFRKMKDVSLDVVA
ncbi:MAG: DNA polymerase III subunit alpha [Bacteroidetes bacterium]|nr:DNA polymerase III subunit alpha [Bacteroidota bacterium]MBS1541557.1 DNA polymerase III subunit alpha [Bacteroidota bacterium]